MTLQEGDEPINVGSQGHDVGDRGSSLSDAVGGDTARDAAGEATPTYCCTPVRVLADTSINTRIIALSMFLLPCTTTCLR